MSSLFPHPGPTLPPFRTVFVHGTYHPSAPIYLCLSHLGQKPKSKAVLLTPSRQTFVDALVDYHDDWLALHAGSGLVSDVSSRVTTFFPPSPTHLAFLLAMFRTAQTSDDNSSQAKTTFEDVPALIVLLEPSSYFLTDTPERQYTISSYLSLVSHALAAVSFLSAHESGATSPTFSLFDSQLDRLKLPILQQIPKPRFSDDDDSQPPRKESASFFARKYFEWMVTFESAPEHSSPSAMPEEERRKQAKLYHMVREDDAILWEWSEVLVPAGETKRKVFKWSRSHT